MICQIEGAANHLGLFSEMYDVRWQEALGNFPQAFTHIGYINSVVSLLSKRGLLRGRLPQRRPEKYRQN
ncbi:MAG: hypothetical protein D6778_08210 [Nitrospirae bacterium]|nr:MAG: hypothetical protein D6778_08210 [Nitrospirota bacterium]